MWMLALFHLIFVAMAVVSNIGDLRSASKEISGLSIVLNVSELLLGIVLSLWVLCVVK